MTKFRLHLAEEVRRIRGVIPGLAIPAVQYEEIIETCLNLDRPDRADKLMQMTPNKK